MKTHMKLEKESIQKSMKLEKEYIWKKHEIGKRKHTK